MFRRICFAYYWATSGGVERVFLNRGEALSRQYPDLRIDFFLHHDWGGVSLIERYLRSRGLSDRIQIVRKLEPCQYDSIFIVDSPQVLEDYPSSEGKMIMECHSPYAEARTYLAYWQDRIARLIVPSREFVRVIESEYPRLRGKVRILRNFVPCLPPLDGPPDLPPWRAPLFLYFARFDELKNFSEFVAAISSLRLRSRLEPVGLACGQTVPGYVPQTIVEEHEVRGSVILLPPVPFERSHMFLRMVRQGHGVFVSCSKGESFGLSAAEAMSAGLPVILSDIPAHAALVGHRDSFLYRLGDVKQLTWKMLSALERYDELAAECRDLARDFSEENFLADWRKLFE